MVILQIASFVLFVTIIVNIIIITHNKTSQKTKLINKFILGFSLMVVSLLGGFTLGAYIIFFAIVIWANILIQNFNNIKIKIVTSILIAITLVEVWFLKPG